MLDTSADNNNNLSDSPTELVAAIGGEPEEGFDPIHGWGRYGSPLFQSTLFKYDKHFEIQSDAGISYETSNDGKVWSVQIRDDILFSDGEPLTAEDVKFTYEQAKESTSIVDVTNVDEIHTPNEYSIEFHLKNADSTFMNQLTTLGILPSHAYEEDYHQNPLGSGPYKMDYWDQGQQLVVEKNDLYYGNQPEIERIVFLFYDEPTAIAAAQSGEVGIVSVSPHSASKTIEGMNLLELDSVDNRGVMLPYVPEKELEENGTIIGNDITSDKSVRKALNIAVNREQLAEEVLQGYGTAAYTPVDGLPWWNEDTKIEDGNIEEAENILYENGWERNERDIMEKDNREAVLTLIYPQDDRVREALTLGFQEMVEPLGVKIIPEGKSWNELENNMHSQASMMGWGSYNPLEQFYLYSKEYQGVDWYNANYYENEQVEEYMELAIESASQEEANEYWKMAQWDGNNGYSAKGDAPWVWLVNIQHLYFINDELDVGEMKIQPHGHGWPVTDNITDWVFKEE